MSATHLGGVGGQRKEMREGDKKGWGIAPRMKKIVAWGGPLEWNGK